MQKKNKKKLGLITNLVIIDLSGFIMPILCYPHFIEEERTL